MAVEKRSKPPPQKVHGDGGVMSAFSGFDLADGLLRTTPSSPAAGSTRRSNPRSAAQSKRRATLHASPFPTPADAARTRATREPDPLTGWSDDDDDEIDVTPHHGARTTGASRAPPSARSTGSTKSVTTPSLLADVGRPLESQRLSAGGSLHQQDFPPSSGGGLTGGGGWRSFAQHSEKSAPVEVLQFDSDEDDDCGFTRKESVATAASSAVSISHSADVGTTSSTPVRGDPRALSSVDLIARLTTPGAPPVDHRASALAHAVDSANRKRKLLRGGLALQLQKVTFMCACVKICTCTHTRR